MLSSVDDAINAWKCVVIVLDVIINFNINIWSHKA